MKRNLIVALCSILFGFPVVGNVFAAEELSNVRATRLIYQSLRATVCPGSKIHSKICKEISGTNQSENRTLKALGVNSEERRNEFTLNLLKALPNDERLLEDVAQNLIPNVQEATPLRTLINYLEAFLQRS